MFAIWLYGHISRALGPKIPNQRTINIKIQVEAMDIITMQPLTGYSQICTGVELKTF